MNELVRDYFPVPTLEKLTSNLIEKQFYSAFNLKDLLELDVKSKNSVHSVHHSEIIGFWG